MNEKKNVDNDKLHYMRSDFRLLNEIVILYNCNLLIIYLYVC